MPRKRIQVRLVDEPSILENKFRRVVDLPRKVVHRIVHPIVVLGDLRRGSLATLDRYLAQNQGIPDREVALELRKLISGSRLRTDFRLLLTEHPDKPKSKGGRPKEGQRPPRKVEIEVARAFTELECTMPSDAAAVEVAARFKIQRPTVYKYAKLVGAYDAAARQAELERLQQEDRLRSVLERREKALHGR